MDDLKERLEQLEHELERICTEIAHQSFTLNACDFDFYNETNFVANNLRELASNLQDTNDEICEILDRHFDTTGTYPDTKHYGK